VMGARPEPGQGRWGAYTVETLIDMTHRADQLTVITGILTQECADLRNLEAT
jgi:hypothetical protein